MHLAPARAPAGQQWGAVAAVSLLACGDLINPPPLRSLVQRERLAAPLHSYCASCMPRAPAYLRAQPRPPIRHQSCSHARPGSRRRASPTPSTAPMPSSATWPHSRAGLPATSPCGGSRLDIPVIPSSRVANYDDKRLLCAEVVEVMILNQQAPTDLWQQDLHCSRASLGSIFRPNRPLQVRRPNLHGRRQPQSAGGLRTRRRAPIHRRPPPGHGASGLPFAGVRRTPCLRSDRSVFLFSHLQDFAYSGRGLSPAYKSAYRSAYLVGLFQPGGFARTNRASLFCGSPKLGTVCSLHASPGGASLLLRSSRRTISALACQLVRR